MISFRQSLHRCHHNSRFSARAEILKKISRRIHLRIIVQSFRPSPLRRPSAPSRRRRLTFISFTLFFPTLLSPHSEKPLPSSAAIQTSAAEERRTQVTEENTVVRLSVRGARLKMSRKGKASSVNFALCERWRLWMRRRSSADGVLSAFLSKPFIPRC